MDVEAPPPEILRIAELAAECGLELRATLPAGPLDEEVLARVDSWLEEGRAGEMGYLPAGRAQMADLRDWKPWTQSALLFALPYGRASGGFREGGRVARYALGRDYHNVLGRRLQKLGRRLRAEGSTQAFRATVDAAPVLEREWALRAGVGFRGKNTLVLHPEHGPWVMLAELLVDFELPAWRQPPSRTATCGSCTRCLDACPTSAFTGPWSLDARRCLSYLTIEASGPIPVELRAGMGDWVFGCDVCLEVCPFGSHAPDMEEAWGTHPALLETSLEDLLATSEQVFHKLFEGSPLRRTGWAGLLRNACVVLGNLGRGTGALESALQHPEPLVRGHAAWALGQIGETRLFHKLFTEEEDPSVRAELSAFLD